MGSTRTVECPVCERKGDLVRFEDTCEIYTYYDDFIEVCATGEGAVVHTK